MKLELSAVQADDTLLDNLGSALPSLAGPERKLCLALMASRVVAEARPVPELVDTDTAVATIAYSVRLQKRAKFTAAAALVVLVVLAFGLTLVPITWDDVFKPMLDVLGLSLDLVPAWCWVVVSVCLSGLAGAAVAVLRMRDNQWSPRDIVSGDRGIDG